VGGGGSEIPSLEIIELMAFFRSFMDERKCMVNGSRTVPQLTEQIFR